MQDRGELVNKVHIVRLEKLTRGLNDKGEGHARLRTFRQSLVPPASHKAEKYLFGFGTVGEVDDKAAAETRLHRWMWNEMRK